MTARPHRSSVWSWSTGLVFLAAVACLVIGILRLTGTFGIAADGGYGTSAVGAPAYAAIFTLAPSPRWFIAGTVVLVLAGAVVVWALTRRALPPRVARGGAAALLAALLLLAIGIAALPRHVPRFGDEPPGFPDVPFHVPGRLWLDIGTALAFVGSGGLISVALSRARPPA